jgi:hypothetical protein
MEKPKHNNKNFGLIEEERLGSITSLYQDISFLPKIIDGSNGWMFFSSEREIQKTKFIDIMDCTVESVLNIYHIFMDFLGGWPIPKDAPIFPTNNLSQRFNAKDSGVTPSGNTTSNADNSIINSGVCDESYWHRTAEMDWATYYATIPSTVKLQAKKSLKSWFYKSYLISPDHQTMMTALDRGLLAVTGYAWAKGANGFYFDYGYQPNHRFVVASYVKGVKWIIRDSYPTDFLIDENSTEQEFVKELDWNFNFGEVKLITISPAADVQNSLIALIYRLFTNLKNMLKGIVMMIPGGAKFKVKKAADGVVRKQEIKTWQSAFASIIDALGCQTATPAELSKIPDTHEFFPNE